MSSASWEGVALPRDIGRMEGLGGITTLWTSEPDEMDIGPRVGVVLVLLPTCLT